MRDWVKEGVEDRTQLFKKLFKDQDFPKAIHGAADLLIEAVILDKKILIFGNGGSAAEAQHFAAELVCQFEKKRQAIPAIALTTDSSILTAQSNDHGFDSAFERQVEALCSPDDVVIGLTTSDVYHNGHSRNIHNAFCMAHKKGAKTIGLFSVKTRNLISTGIVDVPIIVPSENTALIQEVHLTIIHMLCDEIEKSL